LKVGSAVALDQNSTADFNNYAFGTGNGVPSLDISVHAETIKLREGPVNDQSALQEPD
jgi:hypothetical protein